MKVHRVVLLLSALAGCGNHPLRNGDGGADRTASSVDLTPATPDATAATVDVGNPSPDLALPLPEVAPPVDVAPPAEVHPRPPLGEFGSPCGHRLSPYAYSWEDRADGYTWATSCSGDLCLRFRQSDACTLTGCTGACVNDNDCPLGWYCDDTLESRTQIYIGNLPVCRPEPRGSLPTSLTCAAQF
jgi:hypothetical protein